MLFLRKEAQQSGHLSAIPASLSYLPSSGSASPGPEPFGSNDLAFVPPSPKKGPFYDLLEHAPAIGLKLIRQLVDHAISVRNRGTPPGADAMTIAIADGRRAFSQIETYRWSRDGGNGDSCVQSALMALEAWAHRRVDEDEDVERVLADVLPPTGGPAAYLLVAVDLVLSHWPKSRKAAIPFFACPELLCLDLHRAAADTVPIPDILGLDALFKTVDDQSGSDSLQARPSRQRSLDSLLGSYAISGPPEMRVEIADLLQHAVKRLGPYGEGAGKLHPEFIAAQALNVLDPSNFRETSTIGPGGEPVGAWEYVSPPEEKEHLDRLRASASPFLLDRDMQFALLNTVEEPSRSSSELASQAMDWVLQPPLPTEDDAWDRAGNRNLATIAAAVVAMRDGDDDLRARHRAWARDVFLEALTAETGGRLLPESNFRFNPVSMAFLGMVQLLRGDFETEAFRTLLEAAARLDLLAVSGFRVAADTIAVVDERLPRALLRTAFVSCIRLQRSRKHTGEDLSAESERRVRGAIDREIGWLSGKREEPIWPAFPMMPPVRTVGLRIPPISGEFPRELRRPEGNRRNLTV